MQSKIIASDYCCHNRMLIRAAEFARSNYVEMGWTEYIQSTNRLIERLYRSEGIYIRLTTICGQTIEVNMLDEVEYFLGQIRAYVKDYHQACVVEDREERRYSLKYFKEYLTIFWGQCNSDSFDARGRVILFKKANRLCWEVAGNEEYMANVVIRTFCRRFHKMITRELVNLGEDRCTTL